MRFWHKAVCPLIPRTRAIQHDGARESLYKSSPALYSRSFLLIRAFDDPYFNLEGRLLEALARLLAQNVRVYAYPMTAIDLQQAVKVLSAIDLEWSETNGCVSAEQLRFKPPLAHLYAYLLASNFLVPVRVPAESPGDANHSALIREDEPAVGEVCGA